MFTGRKSNLVRVCFEVVNDPSSECVLRSEFEPSSECVLRSEFEPSSECVRGRNSNLVRVCFDVVTRTSNPRQSVFEV